jgi:uncharacterized membrane protein (UPF0127 family)
LSRGLLVALALVLAACESEATPTPTPDPLDVGREIIVVKVGDGVFSAIVAHTPEMRATGLSGREALGPSKGMWFDLGIERSARFWMKDMRFPIDIVWVDADLVVVSVTLNALSPDAGTADADLTLYSPDGDALVHYVLEIGAGEAERQGIKIGATVGVAR